jgi:glycosyltransferase involved in cell wall biosynthesis
VVVGLDARAASEVPAGRGRVLRELLLALDAIDAPHSFELHCREPWREADLAERFTWVETDLPDPIWHAAVALRASRTCDAFVSTNSYLTAWMLLVPSVVVVYDLVPFVPAARAQRRAGRIERATIRPAIRRARRLVCISASTERDLIERFPRAAGKTAVMPLAADARFGGAAARAAVEEVARRHGVEPGGFVLAAGTLEPRKNLLRLIRAHGGLPVALRERHPLLFVGPRGWEEDEILAAAAESREHVRLPGFVSDADLAALYAGCSVFCFPSLYEGFGLPVLEAMASGAPVIASNVSSLPEVGGDAAVYVDPHDDDAIRAALERLLTSPDERTELSERGRRRAAAFSWNSAAEKLVAEIQAASRSDLSAS